MTHINMGNFCQGKISLKNNDNPRVDRKCVSFQASGMGSLYLVQRSLCFCSVSYTLVICSVSLEHKWVAKVVILQRAEDA